MVNTIKKINTKGLQDHALAIYQNGGRGINGWNRLKLFLKQFDNYYIMWEEPTIYIRGEYKLIIDILGTDFFFGNE